MPILSDTSVWDLDEIRLTEKGYFIYTNTIKLTSVIRKSGVNLRTLQQYGLRAKDISKASGRTLAALSKTLGRREMLFSAKRYGVEIYHFRQPHHSPVLIFTRLF